MKEEIKKLIEEFIEDTSWDRTKISDDHDIPTEREPTFEDFINWIKRQ